MGAETFFDFFEDYVDTVDELAWVWHVIEGLDDISKFALLYKCVSGCSQLIKSKSSLPCDELMNSLNYEINSYQ